MKGISNFKLRYNPSNELTIEINSSGETIFNTTSKFIFNQNIEAPTEAYSSAWNTKNEVVVKSDIWDYFGEQTTNKIATFGIRGITTGDRLDTSLPIPFNGTIIGWKLFSTTNTSAILTVKKNSSNISGSDKPTLSSESFNESTLLTDWTTSVIENDIINISVDSTDGDNLILQLLIKL